VASLGSYDPHSKLVKVDKEKASFYLEHGAQPSERVMNILALEKVKLPSWVKLPLKQTGKIRNPAKLRKNRPDEPEVEAPKPEEPAVDNATNEPEVETPKPEEPAVENTTEEIVEEAKDAMPEPEISEEESDSEPDAQS
jgi:hypothetical protein